MNGRLEQGCYDQQTYAMKDGLHIISGIHIGRQ